MDTKSAVDGLECLDCGERVPFEAGASRCLGCAGPLDVCYDADVLDVSRDRLADAPFDGIARYGPVLPFAADRLVTLAEGTTPLVDCPDLAADLGVESVYVKDEGRNPTGTLRDRAFALAVTAVRESDARPPGPEADSGESDATRVVLPTTGDGGQSVAAYAARAGLDVEAFVPTRSTFVTKAMTNVHGGEMSVVEGRYSEAVSAFESAMADAAAGGGDAGATATRSLAPGATPFRHEGLKTLCYEVVEQLDWTVPDALVHPTAHGETLVGSLKAVAELGDAGHAGGVPELHAAQPEACAPLVKAWANGAATPEPWERPDTLVGALEVPDPALGGPALEAVRETGGRAVGVTDDEALEAAVEFAAEGVEASATGGVAAAAARQLAANGHFDADDTVVVVNPVAGNKENDVLRSHLMRKGV